MKWSEMSFKSIHFFDRPPIKSIQFFSYPRGCRMCSASILMGELNTREQSQVSTTQHIISAKNQTNLTGPKLPLPIQWDFIRRFFRTNDDYPDDSGANVFDKYDAQIKSLSQFIEKALKIPDKSSLWEIQEHLCREPQLNTISSKEEGASSLLIFREVEIFISEESRLVRTTANSARSTLFRRPSTANASREHERTLDEKETGRESQTLFNRRFYQKYSNLWFTHWKK
jgi:hypothetical protein